MNSDEHVTDLEKIRALDVARRFVTNFWEHQLLDKETKNHRNRFKNVAKLVLEGAGLPDSKYIAIPVGGIRWAVVDNSDFDAVVCYDYDALRNMDHGKFIDLSNKYNFEEQQRLVFEINDGNWEKGLDLLFTPDDYIVGNLDIARKMRLSIMEEIVKRGGEKYWREEIDKYFRRYFVWWDINVYAPPGKEREIMLGKRVKRMNDRINRRAAKTSDPEAFAKEFDMYRRRMTLPKFVDYYGGLKYSSGKLELDKRYANEGID